MEFTPLDCQGVEKLYKVKIPNLAADINYDRVFEANKGYTPAFIAGAVDRVNVYSLSDEEGEPISEDSLTFAAESLKAQHELYLDAEEASRKTVTVEDKIRQAVKMTMMEEITANNDQIGDITFHEIPVNA